MRSVRFKGTKEKKGEKKKEALEGGIKKKKNTCKKDNFFGESSFLSSNKIDHYTLLFLFVFMGQPKLVT